MSKLPFTPGCPVKVVGMNSVTEFASLDAAKKVFPELDPDINGKRFTWAMHDKINGIPCMRFETWEANNLYSS